MRMISSIELSDMISHLRSFGNPAMAARAHGGEINGVGFEKRVVWLTRRLALHSPTPDILLYGRRRSRVHDSGCTQGVPENDRDGQQQNGSGLMRWPISNPCGGNGRIGALGAPLYPELGVVHRLWTILVVRPFWFRCVRYIILYHDRGSLCRGRARPHS